MFKNKNFILFALIFLGGMIISGGYPNLIETSQSSSPPFVDQSIRQGDLIKILVDVSHGFEVFIPAKVSPMGAVLAATGKYEMITLFQQEIKDSILTDIDILMIATPDPNFPYSPSEIAAIQSFWAAGGNILFVGSTQRFGYEYYRPNLGINRLINALGFFNITFDQDRSIHTSGVNSHALPDHPLAWGITDFYLDNDGCPIIINSNETNALVISDRNDLPNYVAWENTSNRAVFLGGVSPLNEIRNSPATLNNFPDANNYTHHYQVQLNIFHWLSYQTPEKIIDYRPIRMYTGIDNAVNPVELRQLPMFKGICHFHTEASGFDGNNFVAETIVDLGYNFVVVTDYNTIAGGPGLNQTITGGNSRVDGRLIQVINGIEITGTVYHTTGWGVYDTSSAPQIATPNEKIDWFHAQGSPAVLAHPTYSIPPEHPRIYDLNTYNFDGFELVNSGFIHGCGNLVETGKPWYGATDSHSSDIGDMGSVWMYVFAEDISSSPAWWTSAFEESRIVAYVPKDDVYIGDQLIVDEYFNRMNDEQNPIITRNSPTTFTSETEVILDLTIEDASPLTVELTVNGIPNSNFQPDLTALGRYTANLGLFSNGETLNIQIKATDEKGYQSSLSYSISIEDIEVTTTTTIPSSTPISLWFALLPLYILSKNLRKKK